MLIMLVTFPATLLVLVAGYMFITDALGRHQATQSRLGSVIDRAHLNGLVEAPSRYIAPSNKIGDN